MFLPLLSSAVHGLAHNRSVYREVARLLANPIGTQRPKRIDAQREPEAESMLITQISLDLGSLAGHVPDGPRTRTTRLNRFAGSLGLSCGRTTRQGRSVRRTTASATLPIIQRPIPERP